MEKQEQFVRFFREIQPKFSRYYSAILSDVDLTLPQFTLLTQLVPSGSLSMSEVGLRIHISKPAVTSLVDRLENHQFLSRVKHPNDRRVYLLEIQPKGKKIVQKIQAEALKLLMQAYVEFKPNEQKVIMDFYALISEKLDEHLKNLQKGKRENV